MSRIISNPPAQKGPWLPRLRPGLEKSTLLSRLRESPWEFDFFQAVTLLRSFQEDVVDPGLIGPYGRESVRFSARTSLSFPASQIQDISVEGNIAGDEGYGPSSPPRMEVNFIGLQGPSGVLPNYYSHLIQQLDREKDNPEKASFKAWLDIFNHRLTSLFYRTWAKYHPSVVVQSDFSKRPGGFDPYTESLLAILGLGQLVLRDQIGRLPERITRSVPAETLHELESQRPGSPPWYPFEDRFLITHGATISRMVRTATGLANLLMDYLGIPVDLEQFSPRWLPLPTDCQTALLPPSAENRSGYPVGALGTGAICGQRVLDIQSHFVIRIGPVNSQLFNQFLPAAHLEGKAVPSPLLRTVLDLVRFFVGSGLDFDVRLEVQGAAIPDPVLKPGVGAPILGQSLWLHGEKPGHVVDDVVFPSDMSV